MHQPVMVAESLALLALGPGDFVVDGTLGFGGHALMFHEAVGPRGLVLGIEKNLQTLREAGPGLAEVGIRVMHEDFRNIKQILAKGMFPSPQAIFLDLGLSSFLLERSGLGFSFKREDEPLDMRYSPDGGFPAGELLNALPEAQLALFLREYGEEPFARRVARWVVRSRPLETVGDLVACVEKAVPPGRRGKSLHRVFQALRMFVNDEPRALADGLARGLAVLEENGRFAVISYHSGEDRLVKTAGRLPGVEVITRKPLRPSPQERETNPRSCSAKLRVLVKKGDFHEEVSSGILYSVCPPLSPGMG